MTIIKTVLTAVSDVGSLFTAISVNLGGSNDSTFQRNSAFGQVLTRKKVNTSRDQLCFHDHDGPNFPFYFTANGSFASSE
jgi:hypothetical protein